MSISYTLETVTKLPITNVNEYYNLLNMVKQNLKLILILFVAAGVGITLVLGSWLYGSYNQRMELFLATAERTMFDAIQETIQKQIDVSPRSDTVSRRGNGPPNMTRLIAEIANAYPEVSADSLAAFVNRFYDPESGRMPAFRRPMHHHSPPHEVPTRPQRPFTPNEPNARPRQLLPGFLFDQLTIDTRTLAAIEHTFKQGLANSGIHTNFTFGVITADYGNAGLPADTLAGGMPSIRPILIDPKESRFITVTFNRPWQYLLYSLSWQLVISVVLVATLIGCFIYLFLTIFKQNELALLRKTFVNNMTHELRTPVATVSAAVQALQSYTAVEDREKRDKYLSISKEELDHLADLIDRVLLVAEGDQLTIKKLNFQQLNLVNIVQRCVEKAYVHHRDKTIVFLFDPLPDTATIQGDAEHIRNVVANLLDNAAKYGATEVHISLRAEAHSNHVELQVRDNGVGIPKAYQDRIFEPFFRVPEGDLHGVKGNGLGLSYVKQVVVQHNGTVNVKSQPGEGTLFTLTIPKTGYHD